MDPARKGTWRTIIMAGLLACHLGQSATAGSAVDTWCRLPCLDRGRIKPLDTVAREHLRMITGRSGYRQFALRSDGWADKSSVVKEHEPVELYLELLFTWDGWQRPGSDWQWQNPRGDYWSNHEPDKWDRQPLLGIRWLELKQMLGVPEDQDHVSPLFLEGASVKLSGGEKSFIDWVGELSQRQQALAGQEAVEPLSEVETKGVELAQRYVEYLTLRMGMQLLVIPIAPPARPEDERWLQLPILLKASEFPLAQLLGEDYPADELDAVRKRFKAAREAFGDGLDSPTFAAASADFSQAIRELGLAMNRIRQEAWQGTSSAGKVDQLAFPASTARLDKEVSFNRLHPFRIAWIIYFVASLAMGLAFVIRNSKFYALALSMVVAGTLVSIGGFYLRIVVAGRPPVTNLYETAIWVSLVACVLGLVFEFIYRPRYFALAASVVATMFMVLADSWPAVLDPSINPIEPVLRTNFYLTIHVLTIVASYGAGALAWTLGIFALGIYAFRTPTPSARQLVRVMANTFVYRAMQVAVVLLAAGTILGGVWAADSWGRFWGWDPKEIWALISLLCYLLVLHGRYAGLWGTFGLAAGSNLCFLSILMSWYGVNFVLPLFNEGEAVGLHGYGLAEGGLLWAGIVTAVDLAYLGFATLMYHTRWKLGDSGKSEPMDGARIEQEAHEVLA